MHPHTAQSLEDQLFCAREFLRRARTANDPEPLILHALRILDGAREQIKPHLPDDAPPTRGAGGML